MYRERVLLVTTRYVYTVEGKERARYRARQVFFTATAASLLCLLGPTPTAAAAPMMLHQVRVGLAIQLWNTLSPAALDTIARMLTAGRCQ